MRRREFVTLMLSSAAQWPLAARAQARAPLLGFMSSRSPEDSAYLVDAFRLGLKDGGFVEGRNVTVEYRWAHGQYGLLGEIASQFVSRDVAAIVAVGGVATAQAAKSATATIPMVFSVGLDPVKLGLVESLNRPGGNATGISLLTTELEAKRLGLLKEMVPQAARVGVLLNPNNPPSLNQAREVQEAAGSINQPILVFYATTPKELDAALARVVEQRADALLVGADPFFDTEKSRIVAFAAAQRLPALYQFREYTAAGGLMSYGISLPDTYRLVGLYAGRILNGQNAADLPVLQPTTFEFVINLKTARALNLTIPPTLLARADEVIE